MPITDDNQLFQQVMQRISGQGNPATGPLPAQADLAAYTSQQFQVIDSLGVAPLPQAMAQRIGVVTSTSDALTSANYIRLLNASPTIAAATISPALMGHFEDMQDGLASLQEAAAPAIEELGELVLQCDDDNLDWYQILAELAAAKDPKALFIGNFTVEEARIILAAPLRIIAQDAAAAQNRDARQRALKNKGATAADQTNAVTQTAASVDRLIQAAHAGQSVPAPVTVAKKKGTKAAKTVKAKASTTKKTKSSSAKKAKSATAKSSKKP